MDRKKAICEYLRQNHIGKEKAIHSKELEKLFMDLSSKQASGVFPCTRASRTSIVQHEMN